MASTINADTSDGLKLTSDTSGVVDIQSAGTTKMTVGSTIDLQGNELVLDADADTSIHADTDDEIDIKVGGTDVGKFDSTGLEVTSVSAPCDLTIKCPNNTGNSSIFFGDTDDIDVGMIEYGHTANDMGFYTNTSRAMLIRSNGRVDVNVGSYSGDAQLTVTHIGNSVVGIRISDETSTGTHNNIQFLRNGTQVGKIETTNQSSTAFVTSSDYRMKENVNYTWDATTKLKQLKPAEFTWKAEYDSNKTKVQGFLAHEVSDIVPEAVTGIKDATEEQDVFNDDGIKTGTKTVIDPQGIDQSKLVPLLVKTIQELEARITALESE